MAGWGTGSFENEDAQTWIQQLASLTSDDLQRLLASVADSDYPEAPESSVAIAAAEAVAALASSPNPAAPKQITDWVRTQSTGSLRAPLVTAAAGAVQRVRANSELKDLWLQADGLNEWTANLSDLQSRLKAQDAPPEPSVPAESADVSTTDSRALLRHTLATLAYRCGKAVRNSPASFADYSCGESSRTPGQILAHIGDLLDWGLSIAQGRRTWHNAPPSPWEKEINRFFAALKTFDDYLASEALLHASAEKLFQGPVADALTHVGQIAMLRRMAGVPIKGESYFEAEIATGQVNPHQPSPRREFD